VKLDKTLLFLNVSIKPMWGKMILKIMSWITLSWGTKLKLFRKFLIRTLVPNDGCDLPYKKMSTHSTVKSSSYLFENIVPSSLKCPALALFDA